MEHDGFRGPYLSDNTREAAFHGQAGRAAGRAGDLRAHRGHPLPWAKFLGPKAPPVRNGSALGGAASRDEVPLWSRSGTEGHQSPRAPRRSGPLSPCSVFLHGSGRYPHHRRSPRRRNLRDLRRTPTEPPGGGAQDRPNPTTPRTTRSPPAAVERHSGDVDQHDQQGGDVDQLKRIQPLRFPSFSGALGAHQRGLVPAGSRRRGVTSAAVAAGGGARRLPADRRRLHGRAVAKHPVDIRR